MPGLPASAQEEGVRGPLAALEEQRRLYLQAVDAEGSQAWGRGAEACARMARLRHLVPVPRAPREEAFSAVVAWGLDLRRREAAATWERLREAREKAGKPAELLKRVDEAVEAVYLDEEVGEVLEHLFEELGGELPELRGYREEYEAGRWLRQTAGRVPFHGRGLSREALAELQRRWATSSPSPRKDFLRCAALETLALAETVAFQAAAKKPRWRGAQRRAEEVEPDLLMLDPGAHSGDWVTVMGTWKEAGEPTWPVPFAGVLPLEELDAALMVAFSITEEEQRRLMSLGRLGLARGLRGWVRGYPAESLDRIAGDLEPGNRVEVTGRVLPRPGSVPAFVLEVWSLKRMRGRR